MLPMELDEQLTAFSSTVFQLNVEKGTRAFFVHGDILSRHSEPFKSIVNGNWEESAKREINMEEWDAETVSRMIDYLYTGDYTWKMDEKFKPIPIQGPEETPIAEISRFVEGRPLTPLRGLKGYSNISYMSYDAWASSFHHTEQGFEKLLLTHAKVYALAHYRAIEKLSKLALDRLMQTLLLLQTVEFDPQKIGCIVELVAYVYESTCLRLGKPEAMRQAVTRFIGLEITRLNSKGEISELMGTYGDFADDLLVDLTRRIKFSEVNCVIKHKYIAGIEVSESDSSKEEYLPILPMPWCIRIYELILREKVHVGNPQPPNCVQEYHWGSPNINYAEDSEIESVHTSLSQNSAVSSSNTRKHV